LKRQQTTPTSATANPSTSPPTPNFPSRFFGCTDPYERDPSPFHARLCTSPHGRAFRGYLEDLFLLHRQIERSLIAAEEEPDRYLQLDLRLQVVEERIAWAARQKDYDMPSEIPEHLGPQTIDFAAIKARIDLVQYIGQYTQVRPYGRLFKARCPFGTHSDTTPSLTIYPETNHWHCYGCNTGRDIFDFAERMDGLTAHELAGM
jgi:hypothetical protein